MSLKLRVNVQIKSISKGKYYIQNIVILFFMILDNRVLSKQKILSLDYWKLIAQNNMVAVTLCTCGQWGRTHQLDCYFVSSASSSSSITAFKVINTRMRNKICFYLTVAFSLRYCISIVNDQGLRCAICCAMKIPSCVPVKNLQIFTQL